MADAYDECRECGAMVDRMGKHKRWHRAIDSRLDDVDELLARVANLEH